MDRILVIDEPVIANTLQLRLGDAGYEVETAFSTDGAMLHMKQRPFALALVGRILEGDPAGGEPHARLHLLRFLKKKDPVRSTFSTSRSTWRRW